MVPATSTSLASIRSAENRPASGWLTPDAVNAADLHADRRLRGRFARNVRDRDGAAPQVERDLAVACLGAARAHRREGRLDLVCDLPLHVEFEAEKAADRDHDRGHEHADRL